MPLPRPAAEHAPAVAPVRFGEWCVHEGLASPEQIRECLQLQRFHRMAGRTVPRLGELLQSRGYLSGAQVRQILERQTPTPPEVVEIARHPEHVFGRYVLLRQIGRGGFGRIYLAWDPLRRQRVAIKRIRADREEGPQEAVDALAREVQHASRLSHPGIVSLFEAGRVGDDHYVSLEYVEGLSLDEDLILARSEGQVSPYHRDPRRIVRVLAEAARALHFAHTHPWPVVHGDVKPGNLMVDLQGRAHVLDFGLARRMDVEAPQELEVCGTPNYMAPEQASGRVWEMDARTDVYGLGAVLYEMLSGRPPFTGEPLTILMQVAKEPPPRPSDVLRRIHSEGCRPRPIPPALEALCLSCLEKDKARRPASLLEVAEQLETSN